MQQEQSEVETLFLEKVGPLQERIAILKEKDQSNDKQIEHLKKELDQLRDLFSSLRPLKSHDKNQNAKPAGTLSYFYVFS